MKSTGPKVHENSEPIIAASNVCAYREGQPGMIAHQLQRLDLAGARLLILTDLHAAHVPAYRNALVALAELTQAAGAEVTVGGSPWLRGESVTAHWQATGLDGEALRHGWTLADFERLPLTAACAGYRMYHLPRILFESDLVINLAYASRHRKLRLAGAMFSVLHALPGIKQATLQRVGEAGSCLDDVIVDLTALIAPALHALLLPSPGTAQWLWSADPLALDATAAHLLGLNPDDLAWLSLAAESGLGLTPIEEEGPPASERVLLANLPEFVADRLTEWPELIESWVGAGALPRLVVDSTRCNSCGVCGDICPTGASGPAAAAKSLHAHTICLRCGRCRESCPSGAISLRPGRLGLRQDSVRRNSCDN